MQTQSSLSQSKVLCHETNRAVSKIKDIYSSFATVEDKYVVKQTFSKDSNAADLYSEDEKNMPGRIYIGDITSDGYPDILVSQFHFHLT